MRILILTEVRGGWRKLQTGDFHSLYSLPNIIMIITLWRIRWVGQVPSMGEESRATKFCRNTWRKPSGRLTYA